ncbi:hypothetical protein [Rivihabitans pingtungensis]|uniref:Uncharacterized protein n=1 Tax=Rivihabitans pingtungensis TaxID=1054498 RepID=A0A318KC55_9NEIS|nr:hypothetical protein [Rivihabitans pingtungensis]PXX73671.1 hypothetical protein DFR34_1391 [Rivihabitans pingtungensis]
MGNDARSKLDILYQDALGDIAEIIQRIEDLQKDVGQILPGQFNTIKTEITDLIGLLSKAGDIYRAKIHEYSVTWGETARQQIEADVLAAKTQFNRETADSIKRALSEVSAAMRETVQREVTEPAREVIQAQKNSIRGTIILCLVAGIWGGMMALAGYSYLTRNDASLENEAKFGRAVAAVWEKLDKKSQAAINQEQAKK